MAALDAAEAEAEAGVEAEAAEGGSKGVSFCGDEGMFKQGHRCRYFGVGGHLPRGGGAGSCCRGGGEGGGAAPPVAPVSCALSELSEVLQKFKDTHGAIV